MSRVLFLGQKAIGERCFDLLEASSLEVRGVSSNTSQDVWWGTNGIYQKARNRSIPFIATDRPSEQIPYTAGDKNHTKEMLELIFTEKIDLILSVQHPWILPKSVLEAVNHKAYNLHNAKLPEYKGYNAVNHSILNGEKRHFSTVHKMVEEVDAGDLVMERSTEIYPEDTALSLYDKTGITCEQMFAKFMEWLERNWLLPATPQKGESHFYPRNSLDKEREINNPVCGEELDPKSRAFYFPPFEPAFIRMFGGAKHYVLPEIIYVGGTYKGMSLVYDSRFR